MWGCREVSLCWEGAGGGVGVLGRCEPPLCGEGTVPG